MKRCDYDDIHRKQKTIKIWDTITCQTHPYYMPLKGGDAQENLGPHKARISQGYP